MHTPYRTVRPTLSLVGGVATQEYQAHSDWIDMQAQQPSGPRVFTFFLYLRLTMHSTALHIPVLPAPRPNTHRRSKHILPRWALLVCM
eukprot:COSAG01_NODE_720_length_14070_cov_9.960633_5_plen_88_part_00